MKTKVDTMRQLVHVERIQGTTLERHHGHVVAEVTEAMKLKERQSTGAARFSVQTASVDRSVDQSVDRPVDRPTHTRSVD